jgi:hypothetical protein
VNNIETLRQMGKASKEGCEMDMLVTFHI